MSADEENYILFLGWAKCLDYERDQERLNNPKNANKSSNAISKNGQGEISVQCSVSSDDLKVIKKYNRSKDLNKKFVNDETIALLKVAVVEGINGKEKIMLYMTNRSGDFFSRTAFENSIWYKVFDNDGAEVNNLFSRINSFPF